MTVPVFLRVQLESSGDEVWVSLTCSHWDLPRQKYLSEGGGAALGPFSNQQLLRANPTSAN